MLNQIAANARVRGLNSLEDVKDVYFRVVVSLGAIAMLGVPLMWAINKEGYPGFNWVFFFGGVAMTAIWAFSPTRLLWAMGAGALVQGLNDEDLTKGAIKGLSTWYQIVLGLLLWICIISGLLAVVPFQKNPSAFFPIAGMLFLLTLAFVSVKNGALKWSIAAFAIAVIIFNSLTIVPEDWKFWKNSNSNNQAVSKQSTEQKSKTTEAKWKEPSKDGSLPVGVWSEIFSIGIGCRAEYDAGNGTDFKVRYRLYSPEWKNHPGSENYPPANEVQFMLLKPRSVVPVKVTCS